MTGVVFHSTGFLPTDASWNAIFAAMLLVLLALRHTQRLLSTPGHLRTPRNPRLNNLAALRRRHARPAHVSQAVEQLVLPLDCSVVADFSAAGGANGPPYIECDALPKDCTPALVLVNRVSGGQSGEALLKDFAEHLSPLQVWDLSDGGPTEALTLFRRVPRLRILACGGDGTIGWVGQAMQDANLAPGALLCPVALGTGNDFSRALGW